MIKGLSITPPITGRISIGRVVERNGKRLPEKDDQFTITTQIQGKDGWLLHPLDERLRQGQEGAKLRSIPIHLLFNAPDLNLRADYSLFDRNTGRPMCTGNGETCRRFTGKGIETLPCPAPEGCDLAKAGCKPYARLNVQIEVPESATTEGKSANGSREAGTFIFRTTGFNSIRTLAARLSYFQALSGNRLACLPLSLKLRAKTTTLSHRTPIYYADIVVRDGQSMEDVLSVAKSIEARRTEAGYDQAALDEAARLGLANGAFEDSDEDAPDVVEEFFPDASNADAGQQATDVGSADADKNDGNRRAEKSPSRLRETLERKAGDKVMTHNSCSALTG
jgi:hypothetical protein